MKIWGFLTTCGFCLGASWLTFFPLHAGNLSPAALDTSRMVEDIQILSSPKFSGRQSGTEGGLASAVFVAQRFRELGLIPSGDVGLGPGKELWGQTGPVTATQIQIPSLLEFTTTTPGGEPISFVPDVGTAYLPVLDSPSVHVTAPLVFVGYGISDPARGWDEYEGMDVRNRVVMFLRGKPSHFPEHLHHTEKERIARQKGAVAFVTLTGPMLSPYAARRGMGFHPLAFYTNATDERPLPGVWIDTKVGEQLFRLQGLHLPQTQEALNKEPVMQSGELQTIVHMKWESSHQSGSLVNVLGSIPGSDPVLRHETVILGAHRDHFGEQAGLFFPGADDNASGTALLLELARILKQGGSSKRTILFVSFSGEEQNVLGATWYVQHPARPMDKTIAMINVDHVGVGDGQLTVGVTHLPKDVAAHAARNAGISGKVNLYGFFPGGDHVPFANADIPTIAVVTAGTHPHFHQVSDTPDTIQPEMLHTAAQFVLALTRLLANPQ